MIKKMLKAALKIAGLLLGCIIVYGLVAFVCSRIGVAAEQGSKPEVAIYIKTNGVHTDIVVPVHTEIMDWSREVKYSNISDRDTDYAYLAIGWGDKGFYLETPQWKDLKCSTAFNAAFGRSTTAIHATYYKSLTKDDDCRKIMISREQYARLISHITNSFRKGADGHFIKINTRANYGRTDAFYEANGTYSLLHTCNTWANNSLKECGQKHCLWTIFDTGIFELYK